MYMIIYVLKVYFRKYFIFYGSSDICENNQNMFLNRHVNTKINILDMVIRLINYKNNQIKREIGAIGT